MGLRDLLRKKLAKSEEFKELQRQDKMRQMLEDRKKSSNERELERFVEEKREEQIKMDLEKSRKIRQEELMKTTVLDKSNMFKGKATLLHQDRSVLENNNKLLGHSNFLSSKKVKKGRGNKLFFK